MNRTLFRHAEDCTEAQRFWLRNLPNQNVSQHAKILKEKYNHIAYPDDLFYKTHKIAIKDFVEKLESTEDKHTVLFSLFEDESHKTGRRGVANLK